MGWTGKGGARLRLTERLAGYMLDDDFDFDLGGGFGCGFECDFAIVVVNGQAVEGDLEDWLGGARSFFGDSGSVCSRVDEFHCDCRVNGRRFDYKVLGLHRYCTIREPRSHCMFGTDLASAACNYSVVEHWEVERVDVLADKVRQVVVVVVEKSIEEVVRRMMSDLQVFGLPVRVLRGRGGHRDCMLNCTPSSRAVKNLKMPKRKF